MNEIAKRISNSYGAPKNNFSIDFLSCSNSIIEVLKVGEYLKIKETKLKYISQHSENTKRIRNSKAKTPFRTNR
jgi:hypothetical protein